MFRTGNIRKLLILLVAAGCLATSAWAKVTPITETSQGVSGASRLVKALSSSVSGFLGAPFLAPRVNPTNDTGNTPRNATECSQLFGSNDVTNFGTPDDTSCPAGVGKSSCVITTTTDGNITTISKGYCEIPAKDDHTLCVSSGGLLYSFGSSCTDGKIAPCQLYLIGGESVSMAFFCYNNSTSSNVQTCASVIARKEGYTERSMSEEYIYPDATYACRNGTNELRFVGKGCFGKTNSECQTEYNAIMDTTAATCVKNGNTYGACVCGSGYTTLAEFCTAHPSYTNCTTEYHPTGTACTVEVDNPKYQEFYKDCEKVKEEHAGKKVTIIDLNQYCSSGDTMDYCAQQQADGNTWDKKKACYNDNMCNVSKDGGEDFIPKCDELGKNYTCFKDSSSIEQTALPVSAGLTEVERCADADCKEVPAEDRGYLMDSDQWISSNSDSLMNSLNGVEAKFSYCYANDDTSESSRNNVYRSKSSDCKSMGVDTSVNPLNGQSKIDQSGGCSGSDEFFIPCAISGKATSSNVSNICVKKLDAQPDNYPTCGEEGFTYTYATEAEAKAAYPGDLIDRCYERCVGATGYCMSYGPFEKCEDLGGQFDSSLKTASECVNKWADGEIVWCTEDGITPVKGCHKGGCSLRYKTLAEWCAEEHPDEADCENKYIGNYDTYCDREEPTEKFEEFVEKCPDDSTQEIQKDGTSACKIQSTDTPNITGYCYKNASKTTTKYAICSCPTNYKEQCEDGSTGSGEKCTWDGVDKYAGCTVSCDSKSVIQKSDTQDGCEVAGTSTWKNEMCTDPATKEEKFVCRCSADYQTLAEYCADKTGTEQESCLQKQPKGDPCELDVDSDGNVVKKYKEFADECPSNVTLVGAETACTALNGETSGTCIDTDGTEKMVCRCASDYKTLAAYCIEKGTAAEECASTWKGLPPICLADLDGAGVQLEKYKEFDTKCPTDAALLDDEASCTAKGGIADYKCRADDGTQKVVCSCPAGYVTDAECKASNGSDYEGAGQKCSLYGDTADTLKYQECLVTCSSILTSQNVADDGYAYSYVGTDSAAQCETALGDGATFGANRIKGSNTACSDENAAMYPCFCGADMETCEEDDNKTPKASSKSCSLGSGFPTFYKNTSGEACDYTICPAEEEGPSVTFIGNKASTEPYGNVDITKCRRNNEAVQQISCDTSVYKVTCTYPYVDDDSFSDFCRYEDDASKVMSTTSPKHFRRIDDCNMGNLTRCGESLSSGTTGTILGVADSVEACKSTYGPGSLGELCEYGPDKKYRRAYNCYYVGTYLYNTRNCAVRHDLTGPWVKINGVKHWDKCICAAAYKYHKYNCGGTYGGNPCQQKIYEYDGAKVFFDETIPDDVQIVNLYPYCTCTPEFNQVCDEDGSGRYKGVGTECNGKYKSCECVPDEIPLNWADNYYGCPNGKRPTGVWKNNGCGRKYYQCSVNECTWEYTEQCPSPLIGVGEPCQDNQGNVGGYKSCRCPADYNQTCTGGKVGVGEPCSLKGVLYYKSCSDPQTCVAGETETCTDELLVGVDACVRDEVTYYKKCICAQGYDKVCSDGEVGVGKFCKLNGVKYYKECSKPSKDECTAGHVASCDYNQESYSPCTTVDDNGNPVIKYLCRCPSNYMTCTNDGEIPADGATTCVQKASDGSSKTFYSNCAKAEIDACTDRQLQTYTYCTDSQIGDGGSCYDADGKIKYAECRETNSCVTNGFKYSCQEHDPSWLGEACIDAGGNRLYKECPCPSNFVSCSNSNATRGARCTAVSQDGTVSAPVYASCSCDESIYKYTCNPEGSNLGITAPDDSNYCAIETTSTSDGVTTITESRYYRTCACGEDYKYTCTGNGQYATATDKADYCKLGDATYYKNCGCQSTYAYTAENCADETLFGTGAEPDASSSCTVNGTYGDWFDGTVLYKQCKCKDGYNKCGELDLLKGSGKTDYCLLNNQKYAPDCMGLDKCPSGTKMNPDTYECIACSISNCSYCKEAGVCSECNASFALNETTGQCERVCQVDNCKVCSSDGKSCTTCADGYTDSGSTCVKCNIENCQACIKDNFCQVCKSGYQVNSSTGVCDVLCEIADCAKCSSDGKTCLQCSKGTWHPLNNACMEDPEEEKCTDYPNSACLDFNQNECSQYCTCEACPDMSNRFAKWKGGCKNDAVRSKTESGSDGNTCVICDPETCEYCGDNGMCLKCVNEKWTKAKGKCTEPATDPCADYTQDKCYDKAGNVCTNCDCPTCNSKYKEWDGTCKNGTVVNIEGENLSGNTVAAGQTCVKCGITYCLGCAVDGICAKCGLVNGVQYELTPSGAFCVQPIAGCTKYLDQAVSGCQECAEDYNLAASSCVSTCLVVCDGGEGALCQPCSHTPTQFKPWDKKTCKEGYNLTDGACVANS